QHLRPAHAPQRRARRVEFHRPGPEGRAGHDLRGRPADEVVLLRRRPGPGADRADGHAGRLHRPHQPGEPERVHHPRARGEDHRAHRVEIAACEQAPAERRSAPAPARHRARPQGPGLGARHGPRRGIAEDRRVFRAGAAQPRGSPRMKPANLAWICVALAVPAAFAAVSLDDISNRDAVNGLKQALTSGAQAAVAKLSKPDGFMSDARIRIPLPPSMKRAEAMMHSIGAGKQADDLVLRMNRAAEAAVPQAKPLLVDAAKKMTVKDAKGILTGGPDSATQYFKRATTEPLVQKFKPIVRKSMAKAKLA